MNEHHPHYNWRDCGLNPPIISQINSSTQRLFERIQARNEHMQNQKIGHTITKDDIIDLKISLNTLTSQQLIDTI